MLIRVGSERFMETENLSVPDNLKMIKKECDDRGYTLVIIAVDDKVSGAVELHPTIRPEAKQVIRYLALKGRSACIISGDSEMPTQVLAEELEINRYFASILPEGRVK
ncbi:MAG: HAD family hydrolase [Candidatus Electrothrix sp. AUS3]|nr:HAD family hydrolase [Candidatus Electrothrix gigas]